MGWFKDFFSSEEEEEDKVEKYEVRVFCLNCKITSKVEILKGNSVKGNLRKIKCSNCGLNYFPYSLNQIFMEGFTQTQVETLIDWINVDEGFKDKFVENKQNEHSTK